MPPACLRAQARPRTRWRPKPLTPLSASLTSVHYAALPYPRTRAAERRGLWPVRCKDHAERARRLLVVPRRTTTPFGSAAPEPVFQYKLESQYQPKTIVVRAQPMWWFESIQSMLWWRHRPHNPHEYGAIVHQLFIALSINYIMTCRKC